MAKHADAMAHNDKLLAADEAEGGEAPAAADAPSTTEGKPSPAADQLAEDVGSGLKVAPTAAFCQHLPFWHPPGRPCSLNLTLHCSVVMDRFVA